MSSGAERFDEDLAAAQASLEQLVSRLRSLSPRAWQSRRSAVELGLGRLADLALAAVGEAHRTVPEVPEHALGDAVHVIGIDLLSAVQLAGDNHMLNRAAAELRSILSGTR